MFLARIRRAEGAPVEVAALDRETGALLTLPSGMSGDPVALLRDYGVAELTEAVDRMRRTGAAPLDPRAVLFEPPVATCTKICCLALNYAAHAAESRLEVPPEPVLFFKPPSALIGHRRTVVAPARTRHLEHEVELAIVIGAETRDLPAERWREAVAGYSVINDVTARDLQLANMERNVPWDQAKGFDTFAPLGPYLVTADEVPDPQALELRLEVGGRLRQQANTADMVFGIPRLIEDLSDGMTLSPGDVIATGTVAGLAPLSDGDVMHASVSGLGTLINPVRFTPR
ncbi:5-oxopent-3-ene-1,2,5-tricarboxylate decarboxylase/2-hydroxyhepta-2,4-diene-1,7-dioate isomerase [Hamadaea flava]|uniref:Fumarylacetoacetate hydrolase family protein n=1 Tax=Hamadaea flava TaxID=1742688 RepID=A0ABV8LEB0_9ACTN|nr:fumarylacetoacetate hydrolase family protein [Hamadaea flava]MCP2329456.1 5-oxopent-3-ene-1,2,5-tricarboxylate decarboxylase/2-hydroxyhepta-2,4-diene-1,7-dioate isomerase [Hamadaea flava]